MLKLVATQQCETYRIKLGLIELIQLSGRVEHSKIPIIKAVRHISWLDLKRAKLIVEAVLKGATLPSQAGDDYRCVVIALPEKAELEL